MTTHSDHPLNFRQREAQFVMDRWRASQSVSLVGVGSVGKSNLLGHLTARSVQQHYLGEAAEGDQFRAIHLDPFLMAALRPDADLPLRFWAGYELMIHRLYLAFQPFDVLGERDRKVFYETYQAFQDGTNPIYQYLGLRYFEFGLELFMQRGVQIVFVFDEFEAFLRQLPLQFFLSLRGLRDAHKKQLAFTTFTRAPLPETALSLGYTASEIEPFVELFTDNVCYVGGYSDEDARAMLSKLIARKNKQYDAQTQAFLIRATGGYAGLLRASAEVFDRIHTGAVTPEMLSANRDAWTQALAAQEPVRAECATLYTSLNANERAALKAVAHTGQQHELTPEEGRSVIRSLERKGLLRQEGVLSRIRPPIFAAYVKTVADSVMPEDTLPI